MERCTRAERSRDRCVVTAKAVWRMVCICSSVCTAHKMVALLVGELAYTDTSFFTAGSVARLRTHAIQLSRTSNRTRTRRNAETCACTERVALLKRSRISDCSHTHVVAQLARGRSYCTLDRCNCA